MGTWQHKEFEKCLTKVTYTNKIQQFDFKESGKYPIISQNAEFISGYWDNDKDVFKLSKPVVIFGDHTRCLKYIDFDFVLGADGVKILQTIDEILPKYLYYYLQYIPIDNLGYSRHYKLLKEKIIKYPTIEQQQKIVEILDKADKIRAKKKLANDKLDEFLKSTFISMFGDPVKNDKGFDTTILQNIGSFKNGINYNAGDNGYSIKCIGVGDFKNGTILNSIDKLNSVEVNQTPNEEYFVRKNDIVFVRSNGSKELVGRTLLINTDLQENIVYSGFCIRLRVEQENINNMFLLQLLNTKPIKDNMKNDGHGCNIKSLNQTILGNIPVIIPPIEDQNKFAQIVEKVEAQKQKNELVIEQMNNLFNSLSQRAFKGEL